MIGIDRAHRVTSGIIVLILGIGLKANLLGFFGVSPWRKHEAGSYISKATQEYSGQFQLVPKASNRKTQDNGSSIPIGISRTVPVNSSRNVLVPAGSGSDFSTWLGGMKLKKRSA
ncbi:hypothetical protein I4U23_027269 [Adineta vaga]|nr:hypothetical protein I4U23_027269 [Adineta vaga]